MDASSEPAPAAESREQLESAVVRFAGDSGDGMQLTGNQFTMATALTGNDLATFPDYPAEIRAPVGTPYGVSAFQINFGARNIKTAGDDLDVLVAMNPAALTTQIGDLRPGGLAIIDEGAFSEKNLRKAGYESDPREDGSLDRYRVLPVDMAQSTLNAVKRFGLSQKDALRCKNMWALGLVYWMYGRKRQASVDWLNAKFVGRPDIAGANIAALNAGHAFGETAELPAEVKAYSVPAVTMAPGLYRTITGTEAIAWGLVAGCRLAGIRMTFCSYPITPASALLHSLAAIREYGVTTFQAEDEIGAVCAAIGASYAGALGVTSSSGPGIALKTEALGLAVAVELPLVVVNSQRGGPSTGLPTKTEQADLLQAVFGRNADAPLCVLAARSAGDCFDVAIEAVRIATAYMTPVILLSDGYLANAAEPWRIPDMSAYAPFPVSFAADPGSFAPFARDPETLARPWAVPGTPGLEHRIGGLERQAVTGEVSYDPDNHQRMTRERAARIAGIADGIAEQTVEDGSAAGPLAVVGWGSTYGPISRAVDNLRRDGLEVSHIHLRHLWPLPRNLGTLLRGFGQVLVPEMNAGQLVRLLRAEYLVPAESLGKVTGKPFRIAEIEDAVRLRLETPAPARRAS